MMFMELKMPTLVMCALGTQDPQNLEVQWAQKIGVLRYETNGSQLYSYFIAIKLRTKFVECFNLAHVNAPLHSYNSLICTSI